MVVIMNRQKPSLIENGVIAVFDYSTVTDLLQYVVTLTQSPGGHLCRSLGACLHEPVIPEQHQQLVGVHQMASHEGF